MQAPAMCLEIDLAGSCVFEHRHNLRPERCKLIIYISTFVGFVVYDSTLNLNMILQLRFVRFLVDKVRAANLSIVLTSSFAACKYR